MAEIAALVIGSVTTIGLGIFYKGITQGSYLYGRRMMRIIEKKKLKLDLETSIKELSYENFRDTCYKIKVYDTNYNKQQLIKSMKQYRFTEKEIENQESFLTRFDLHFKRMDSIKPYLMKMISNEIEKELSIRIPQNESRLDL